MSDGFMSDGGRVAISLAFMNAVITGLVLVSPIGIGEGTGMIGDSIVRMLIIVFLQAPIGIAGIVASFYAMSQRQSWLPGLIASVVVPVVTLFLYFAQSRTIERFL